MINIHSLFTYPIPKLTLKLNPIIGMYGHLMEVRQPWE